MKRNVSIYLYIGMSCLFFSMTETSAQTVSTTLSITLHPFLSVNVNPVFHIQNEKIIVNDSQRVDPYHQCQAYITINSNTACEIQIKEIDFPFRQSAVITSPCVKNNVKTGNTEYCDAQDRGSETVIGIGRETVFYSLSKGNIRYTITAL